MHSNPICPINNILNNITCPTNTTKHNKWKSIKDTINHTIMLIIAGTTSNIETTLIIEVISAEITPITEDIIGEDTIKEDTIIDTTLEMVMISIKTERIITLPSTKIKIQPSNPINTGITRINTIKIITTTIISIRTADTIRNKIHIDPISIQETTRITKTTLDLTQTTTLGTSPLKKK